MQLFRDPNPTGPVRKPGFISVNTQVCLEDLDTQEVFTFNLVSPENAASGKGRLSVTSPLGIALQGRSAGDIVRWRAPTRLRRFRVASVLPLAQ